MKTFAVVAAAAALATVNAATCDTAKLAPLLTESYTTQCATDSGYTFTSLAVPDAATLAKMCTSSACAQVLAAVVALDLGDCSVGTLNVQDLISTYQSTCGSGSTASSGSAAAAGSSSTTVTVASSSSGAATAAGSSSTAATTSTTTTSGSSSSTGSVATSTSGAASVALASGAMVFATAAMFL